MFIGQGTIKKISQLFLKHQCFEIKLDSQLVFHKHYGIDRHPIRYYIITIRKDIFCFEPNVESDKRRNSFSTY